MKEKVDTKYVTLNENVQSGTSYALDLSVYGKNSSTATITAQPSNYTVSQVDQDAVTARNIYHFSSDTKIDTQEKVVIEVTEKNNSRCHHDDDKTVVTINFTVSQ